MKLREILKGIEYSISGCDNTEVTDTDAVPTESEANE